jgi:hypothetical protein
MKTITTFKIVGGDSVTFNAQGQGAVIMAGWTGRNAATVQKHIDELAASGVRAPSQVPVFYRVSASLITTADSIEVVGTETSGEIEIVVMQVGGRCYVGVGSDHTDNNMEAHSVALAKQLCPKVMSPELWRFDEVMAHWDRLELRAFVTENGVRTLYQQAPAAEFRTPDDMLRLFEERAALRANEWLMFCGACSAIGGIRQTPHFEIELRDPILGRVLRHAYRVRTLPIEA